MSLTIIIVINKFLTRWIMSSKVSNAILALKIDNKSTDCQHVYEQNERERTCCCMLNHHFIIAATCEKQISRLPRPFLL